MIWLNILQDIFKKLFYNAKNQEKETNQANQDEVKTQLFGDCFVIDVVVMLFY